MRSRRTPSSPSDARLRIAGPPPAIVAALGVAVLVLALATILAGLPAIVVAGLAAFVAMAGCVYAGRTVREHDTELMLPRRATVERRLGRLLDAGPATAVIVIPERFHEVVASVGPDHARTLLCELAGRLEDAAGPDALVGRAAPYAFAVALPGAGDEDGSDVTRLLDVLRDPIVIDGVRYPLDAVAGVARGPRDATGATELLARAEIALHAGHGPQRHYHASIERTVRNRRILQSDLETAIATGQLDLYFQPIVEVGSGAVECVEALVRWDHPRHGTIPPLVFVPLAEQTNLIGALTEHVLGLALDHCAAWRREGRRIKVAVNLSACNVTDPGLPARLETMLRTRGLDGSALKLEVTESVLVEQPQIAAKALAELRALGITMSLDDFGTGFSSLAYLRDFPLDELKIDRSFVRGLNDEPRSAAVVRAIVALAGELGLATVAEGVEDRTGLERIAALGCTHAQGFHFTRPLAPNGLRFWLDRRDGSPQALIDATTSRRPTNLQSRATS